MAHKIYVSARRRLVEIWDYTEKTWGEEQADSYIKGLFADLDLIARRRSQWKTVQRSGFEGIYYAKYRRHFIFFRDLNGELGVLTVLHESMDIPNRLLDDSKESE